MNPATPPSVKESAYCLYAVFEEDCRRKRTITATGSSADVRAPELQHLIGVVTPTMACDNSSCVRKVNVARSSLHGHAASFVSRCRGLRDPSRRSGHLRMERHRLLGRRHNLPQQVRHDAQHCFLHVKCSCGWLTSYDFVGGVVVHVGKAVKRLSQ